MAMSIDAIISFFYFFYCHHHYYFVVLILAPLVAAQSGQTSIQPSDERLPTLASPLILTYSAAGKGTVTAIVAPLTPAVGLGLSLTALNAIQLNGTIRIVDAHTPSLISLSLISPSDIAYISCDTFNDTFNNSSYLSPTDVINEVIKVEPNGILLYSLRASHCSITGTFNYGSILSMTSEEDAHDLQSIVLMATSLPNATIVDEAVASTAAGQGQPNATGGSTNQTPAPTTAVAMSILYSITGIITLLFLVIIVTGAIRAHRHPERYGPRVGFPGRPRQSRAKGLARAMLEALPIVKFGDPEPAKPGSGDIGMEEGVSEVHGSPETVGAPAQKTERESELEPTQGKAEDKAVQDSGMGPDIQAAEGTNKKVTSSASELGCSICTEDFEKGVDVRVLPCNHKFHPACIDPWLLNVSGTCPLCRVDLRPVDTNTSETEPNTEGNTSPLPPAAATEIGGADTPARLRGRVARRLDAVLLRTAPGRFGPATG